MATNKYIIGPNMMYIFVRLKPISITFILSFCVYYFNEERARNTTKNRQH